MSIYGQISISKIYVSINVQILLILGPGKYSTNSYTCDRNQESDSERQPRFHSWIMPERG